MTLVGYSFGARVITGALHLLAGGQVAGRRLPQPLGSCGPACGWRPEKIELLGVSCSVGRAHDWASYMHSAGLLRRMARYTFLDTLQPEAGSEGPGFPKVPPGDE